MELKDSENNNLGVGVYPITNCPHFQEQWGSLLMDNMEKHKSDFCKQKCQDCDNIGENWVCLVCGQIFCSRYVKEHMVKHNEQTKHSVALSFSDGSFWCYDCDYYITNSQMDHLRKIFADVKFKETKELEDLFDLLNLEEPSKIKPKQEEEKKDEDEEDEKQFTTEKLVDGIQEGLYQRVGFLTGAGLSVAAGIPDFRTPGTGLYSQLEKYNLPFPEAVFELGFFKKNPKPFCTLAKEFLTSGCKPTLSHMFIAEFEKQGILGVNMSQNIDGLEFDAGVSEEKLVQAHGHFRTAHCVNKKCKKSYCMKKFQQEIANDEIPACSCGQYIKPDIVFFGEALPNDFFRAIKVLESCDLVFVMGTSLKVQPFASLVECVPEYVPLVLMNMENPGIERENFLFLQGDLDENSKMLMEKLEWKVPDIKKVPVKKNEELIQTLKKDQEEKKQEDDDNEKSKL